MKYKRTLTIFVSCFLVLTTSLAAKDEKKKKILVVDSYHREYLWSQYTNEGFCAAMLKYGYFDNKGQADEFTAKDYVESSKNIIRKLWMDAKRKTSKEEKAVMTNNIFKIAKEFGPDLIFIGEDDAAEYIGNQFLDYEIPIVFWGINDTPVKYGLVDDEDRPGHNVTGVYQTTYYKESLELLKKLVPKVKTFAVLSDDTTTGRIFAKSISHLDHEGKLPLKLVDVVTTNEFEVWKSRALELQNKVDAFFVAQYAGMKDDLGKPVPDNDVAKWYLTHIKIPEAAGFKHRVVQGLLCAADDSGFNQGYEAVVIARDILADGAKPASYRPRAPARGPYMVNKQRAKMLGITLTREMGIEEYFEAADALKDMDKKTANPDLPKNIKEKKRLLVVSSYHKEYDWSKETNEGLCAAMLKFGYFDNKEQADEYTRNDYVETSKVVVKKLWLDAKRKSAKSELEENSIRIFKAVNNYEPNLIFLGDDEAANYVGTKFLDTEIPIVFWGLNNSPVKYGLLDSAETPGHNATGVYQSGYYIESLQLLQTLAPKAKTFAVLSDATATGRSHYKEIEYLARQGKLSQKLIESISTDSFEQWKSKALELQEKVDAFFVAAYSGLKDANGNAVQDEDVVAWYINHIKIPETTRGLRVRQGLLCSADDPGFNQGFEAVVMAQDILEKGVKPATYPPRVPQRGPFMVNKKRAAMLGIKITKNMGIDEIIE